MRILIACEFSGVVREAFRLRGHDAWSCDLMQSEILGNHYVGKVEDILEFGWDMMIAHPPCTYLCNSGVRWIYSHPDRLKMVKKASTFFLKLWNAPIKKICLENPIPHKYAMLPAYTQIIQPWQHGHGETKATCLWLKELPKIRPSNVVSGRDGRIHRMPPTKNRGHERSRTYQGIADAMASQWAELI